MTVSEWFVAAVAFLGTACLTLFIWATKKLRGSE